MMDEKKLLLDVWTSLISLKQIASARKDLDKYEIAKLGNATRLINIVQDYFANRPNNPTVSLESVETTNSEAVKPSENKDLLPVGQVRT